MNKNISLMTLLSCLLAGICTDQAQGALGTAFIYQGRLLEAGVPANGGYDFQFQLFADTTTQGAPIASLVMTNIQTTNGLFFVPLDFGAGIFDGEPRWLDIAVRSASTQESFSSLSQRQPILAVPYALYATTAASVPWSALTNLPSSLNGAGAGLALSGTNFTIAPAGVVNAMLAPGAVGSANLQIGAVTTPRLAENAVLRSKIATGQVVKSLNLLTDDIRLAEGANIYLETGTNTITLNTTNLWQTTGNNGTTADQFIGTLDDRPLELRANSQRILRLEPHDPAPNIIGGAGDNSTWEGVFGATLSGGSGNLVTDPYGVIGGGVGNQVGNADGNYFDGRYATVGGGQSNTASGEESTVGGGGNNRANGAESTVSGGRGNSASGYAAAVSGGGGFNATLARNVPNRALGFWSFIGGGSDNTVTNEHGTIAGGENNASAGQHSSVGGGKNNAALANYAMVPGGRFNSALGIASYAAGNHAKAAHDGAFVWADSSSSTDFSSAGNNEYAVRCAGGARLVTSEDGSTGVQLPPGGGSWSSLSDRQAKENFTRVNSAEILERLATLPVTTWNYKAQSPAIRHIGATAQDFAAAFNVGEDIRHISTIDADGVALAAIQGLHSLLHEQASQIQAQEQEIKALKDRLASLEQLMRAGLKK